MYVHYTKIHYVLKFEIYRKTECFILTKISKEKNIATGLKIWVK